MRVWSYLFVIAGLILVSACSETKEEEKTKLKKFQAATGAIRLKDHSFSLTGEDQNGIKGITKLDDKRAAVIDVARRVGGGFYLPGVPADSEITLRIFQTNCKSMEDLYSDSIIASKTQGFDRVENFQFHYTLSSYKNYKRSNANQTELVFVMQENKVSETCPMLYVYIPVTDYTTSNLGDLRASIRHILRSMISTTEK